MLYADRGFISINGARLVDVQSAMVRVNNNAKPVPSMTPDRFNRGFVLGNTDIEMDFSIAVENSLATPKLESIDYSANDLQATFVVGADQYVLTGLFNRETDLNASGVGEVVKKEFKFGALKYTDAIGNSSLFNLSLS